MSSKSQKRSRCFLDLFLFCLLGYVTYPPNPLSVKGAYGAESVVCTSDPRTPLSGVGGVNIVRENCLREAWARVSFSALAHSDNRKIIAFFCAFRGRVRDHIDNPSKPPFKFTSLLFVATARKNKFICSSLALIAMLIREALFRVENEILHDRPQVAPYQGRGGGINNSSRICPQMRTRGLFSTQNQVSEKSETFYFLVKSTVFTS